MPRGADDDVPVQKSCECGVDECAEMAVSPIAEYSIDFDRQLDVWVSPAQSIELPRRA
ncbi:hypothetical protein J2Y68_003116 [Paenarthrobacter nitroguajacolicus]|nr:hypothetical protein [Paenarthrobacter nitroguajacolicus]MDR6639455.1 hypothetical protein [Paenarthrobacter nitroguajacolicus]